MKKNFLIGIAVVAIIVAGAWIILKLPQREKAPISDAEVNEQLLNADVPAAPSNKSDREGKPPSQSETNAATDALKARAMEIVSQPIIVKSNVSDASRKNAIDEINYDIKLIKENYDQEEPWLALGNYRKFLGDFNGAITAWTFLTEIRPKGFVALHNLGILYGYDLKNYPKAEEYLLKAIQNSATDIDAYAELATIYGAYNKNKIEPFLLSGISANPNVASLKIMLGQYYESTGNKTGAIKYYEEALKQDPLNTTLRQDLAKLQ